MARCSNCGHPAQWHDLQVAGPDGQVHPRACRGAFCLCLNYVSPNYAGEW